MDIKRFRKINFIRPHEIVDVPELVPALFDTVEEAKFSIVGLESNDVFLIKETIRSNNPLAALAKAFTGGQDTEMAEAFRRFLPGSKATAGETMSRIEFLIRGVIDADGKTFLGHTDGARIAQHFPDLFIRVTDRIMKLSGDASTVQLDR